MNAVATTMVERASKRAKNIVQAEDVIASMMPERFGGAFKDAPAVVMAPDGEFRVVTKVGREYVNTDCATAEEAVAVLVPALATMTLLMPAPKHTAQYAAFVASL